MAKSLKGIALIVALGTLLSKLGGLIRQLIIAAAFGVGAAYDAYNYAYVLPGFLLILLGGINGPFHSAMVSVLSRRPRHESAHILASLNTITSTFLLGVTAGLVIGADPIIRILGPSLSAEVHNIAVVQLQVMAPIALFAGLIGLGFGSLNASEEFWIPAVAPLMTSVCMIIGVGILWLQVGSEIGSMQIAFKGGLYLAIATLAGALLQWIIQLQALFRNHLARIKLTWDWNHPGVQEVLRVMAPATLSTGMLQINVFTDLFFASGIIGAASGLSYANLLIQTPLGLISNILLVPLLPTLSKLTSAQNRPKLIARIRQGLMLSTSSMVALGTLFIVLSGAIVTLIYERGAFDKNATTLVTSLLIAYGVGMPVYLGRDLLVRIFYALGDGMTPFKLSTVGIVLNIFLDWILVGGPSPWGNQLPFNFGATGLVIATVIVNLFTCITLIIKLNSKLNGLPLRKWSLDILKLFLAGLISGLAAWSVSSFIQWSPDYVGLIPKIFLTSIFSIILFGLISSTLGVKEVDEIFLLAKRKVISR